MLEQLAAGLHQLGYDVTPEQLDLFETFRAEMVSWNQRVNLTSIAAPDEVETRHFLDSISVLQALGDQARPGLRIIDVGSGAGFPGIPLKLVLPKAHVTLLEATGKKVEFLRSIVATLGLGNTEVVYGRAEDVAHSPAYRETFDIAVARGVAGLATLAEICLPFVSVGGQFIAQKKGDLEAELGLARVAIARLGGAETRLVEVALPQLQDQRYLVCSTKVAPSPARYPRRSGMPFKHPL